MKVLITGGAGFVGSHLTDRLLAEDHDVLVIDNYRTGRRDNLQPHDSLRVVEDTIADADLDISIAASGGPGGQSVNTTNSAVQLRTWVAPGAMASSTLAR